MSNYNPARNIKPSHKTKLCLLSGNRCAIPGCEEILWKENTFIGKFCHIEAASPSGPRYNPEMTDDERRNVSNIILLCAYHNDIIDNLENVNTYTVERLHEIKAEHEAKQTNRSSRNISENLTKAINAIVELNLSNEQGLIRESKESFAIEQKIKFNALKEYKYVIREYSVYFSKINRLYNELDEQGTFKKEMLLSNIRHIYLKIKGKYVDNEDNEILTIQENADNIFEDIQSELFELTENKDIDFACALSIIIVDAFIRCEILERPPA